MSEEKIEFVLFLQPTETAFYSYSAARGIIVREEEKDVPKRILSMAKQQVEELRICMEGVQRHEELTTFQRRPIPLNLLTERKFKYPVYYTEENLPASSLENFKLGETAYTGQSLNDYISAVINVTELRPQLQKSKKGKPSDFLTIDIKLITSVNEVVRTINRVILQDYGVVITMGNQRNKLIFKIKDIEEYLYGNESIANFQYIRECLTQRKAIHLELMEVSIYDKEQFLKFVFHRNKEDVIRGAYAGFPWDSFIKSNSSQTQFLLWHVPEEEYMHPVTTLDMQKLYSPDQLIRTTYKIKLKMEEKKRLKTKKIPRFLWKYKMMSFISKRREELKNRYVQIQGGVVYSGECLSILGLELVSLSGVFGLFRRGGEAKGLRKKVLRFEAREVVGGEEGRLPSMGMRTWQLTQLRRKGMLQIVPAVMNVCLQFVLGTRLLHVYQTSCVTVDNYQVLKHKVTWDSISKIPMETTLVLKVQVFNREGDGSCFGVGAVKLFDSCGFLRQGMVEVELHAVDKMEYLKVGCFEHLIDGADDTPKVLLEFPTFKSNVIWSLSDQTCGKYLGFMPPLKEERGEGRTDSFQPDRVNELLRSDPLSIHKYSSEERSLLRNNWKYYKHQSEKLINFLLSIEWEQPQQVALVYQALDQWAPLKPIEALFLLLPSLPDQRVRYYAVRRMENFLDYQWVIYANQITQSLISFETDLNPLIDLILQKCTFEPYSIGQEYFWQFRNRLDEQFTARRFGQYLQSLLMISSFRKDWVRQVQVNNYLIKMNGKLIAQTQNMDDFNDKNKHFLGMLGEVEENLRQICPKGFSFPIRPQYIFNTLKGEDCTMYDSKKLPFTLACLPGGSLPFPTGQPPQPYKVMFKYGDDIKQDHLVLQLLRVFDKLWKQNNLDCKMNIYRTLSTGNEIGFIQIVEGQNNSKIHKVYGKGLVQAFDQKSMYFFLEQFNRTKEKMAIARQNFIRSSVGYLVGTFVLGVGDRHSGNIMLQPNGKYFHIDFGHFLGDFKKKLGIKRERTPFVFTSESVYVMGGEDSPHFKRFLQDCSKAYIILRQNSSLIVNLLAMMVGAEIPQLRRMEDVWYVVEKLSLELSDQQAGDKLTAIIRDTLDREKTRKLDNAFHQANRVG